MWQRYEILLVLVGLDRGIFGDDSCTRTRRVQQNTVESTHDARKFSGVVAAHDDILHNCSQLISGIEHEEQHVAYPGTKPVNVAY
jgi:hypothetical protein